MDGDEDLSFIKMEKPKLMQKKMATWVSSSFDDFASSFSSQPVRTPLRQSQSSITTSKSSSKPLARGKSPFLSQQTSLDSAKKQTSNFPQKRPRMHSELSTNTSNFNKPQISTSTSSLWAEEYKPSNRAELAVHKKKVEEISDWLTRSFANSKKHRGGAPMLVLSGPPGSGKTACIHTLCQDMAIALQQWENASSTHLSQDDFNHSATQERSKVDVYTSQSQGTQFSNYLLRANKYSPLATVGPLPSSNSSSSLPPPPTSISLDRNTGLKSIVLIEELPNLFVRDPHQLHSILRKYRCCGQSPLVFVMTESNSSGSNLLKLFPKDLQAELHITTINVNPVAPTMMTKCLNRILDHHRGQKHFYAPSPTVLELISQGCAGDLRAALNMLQFACSKRHDSLQLGELQDSSRKMQRKGSNSSKGKRSESSKGKGADLSSQSLVAVKDTSVFLFHAVGKILYFKRGNPADFPSQPTLPDHLASHDRDPLLVYPEAVVSKVHISSDMFTAFLHENYLNFMTSITDLESASDYFSHADIISSVWTGRQELEEYSVSLSTRGYIHSNSTVSRFDSKRKNMGWCPLHKSQWYPTVKQASENLVSAKQLFRGCPWEPEVLVTELIPYIHFTNPTLHDPNQISFVHQLTQFSKKSHAFRSRRDQLNEKDAVEDEQGEEEETQETRTSSSDTSLHLNNDNSSSILPLNKDTRLTTTTITKDKEDCNQSVPSHHHQVEAASSSASVVFPEVDESMWGSDWEADDEDLLGSQNNVATVKPQDEQEQDQLDFVIDDFDD